MSGFDEIIKIIGENDAPTTVKTWLNTGSPLLNDAISGSYHGGFPVGRMVEMYGYESCGKTAVATQAMIAAQRKGGVAMFNDHENSFDHHLAESMGLNTSDRWIFKTPDTFEDSIGLAAKAAGAIRERKLITPDAPIIVVFDSLASMVPKSKFEKDAADYNMNDTTALARATSSAFPALAKFCELHQFTALFLNQVRTKPGVTYGDPETTPGGNAPAFYASVRVSLSKRMISKGEGAKKEIIGQTVTANVKKNKVHRPFEKAKWDFMFTDTGEGAFDTIGPVIDVLTGENILTQAGARIEWDGKKLYKADIIERIRAEGRQKELFAMLPGWKADVDANGDNGIDWSLA